MSTQSSLARTLRRVAIVTSLALVGGACERATPAAGAAGEAVDASDPQLVISAVDSTRLVYRSEVDEGIGVAVDILLDQSGSMLDPARGDERPKYVVAREAIERMLDATDSALARRPDFPVRVALHVFSDDVTEVLPMQPYQRDTVRAVLARLAPPTGGTAIGRGLDAARTALYRSGMYRKNIIVVTDGDNTVGPIPSVVARRIHERSEGGVRMYFVAFDIDARTFRFAREVRGDVIPAANGAALGAALDSLYQGRVLAEALDAGEPMPAPAATATSPRGDTTSTGRRSRTP